MAIHSSVLAWRIQWTEEPGRVQSMGSQGVPRVGHDWCDLACTYALYYIVFVGGKGRFTKLNNMWVIKAIIWVSILHNRFVTISSVQFSRSVMSNSLRPHESQHSRPPCPSPTARIHSRLTSIESVRPSSHLILCRPRLLLPPLPPSIRVFPNESTLCMRWPKYWSFSFSIIPSKEHGSNKSNPSKSSFSISVAKASTNPGKYKNYNTSKNKWGYLKSQTGLTLKKLINVIKYIYTMKENK